MGRPASSTALMDMKLGGAFTELGGFAQSFFPFVVGISFPEIVKPERKVSLDRALILTSRADYSMFDTPRALS